MDLKALAKIYFDHNKELKEIFATKDGHFFYEKGQAVKHCNRNQIAGDDRCSRFVKADFVEVKKPKSTPKKK